MNDSRHLALFLVGFGLLLGGFVVGLGAASEAVRRRHFPHRSAFWTRR